MPYRRNYPATVAEILDPDRKYKPDVLRAVKAFARAKPWRGDFDERCGKLRALNARLARIYRMPRPKLRIYGCSGIIGQGDRNGSYEPGLHRITLYGLSVVTYLHEFAHALGKDERQACVWSINLFRRVFPRSYAACRHVGHTLQRS